MDVRRRWGAATITARILKHVHQLPQCNTPCNITTLILASLRILHCTAVIPRTIVGYAHLSWIQMQLSIDITIVQKRRLVLLARCRCLETHHVLQQNDAGKQIVSFATTTIAIMSTTSRIGTKLVHQLDQMQEALAAGVVQLLLRAVMIVLPRVRLAGRGHGPDVGAEGGQVGGREPLDGVGGQRCRWRRRSSPRGCRCRCSRGVSLLLLLLVALSGG
mmetsp:Transcript_16609/g.47670  ORF Transcript_16609/g.47670 Transcript_16609/m.47670 type:complete len:218 (+) Transcript_16609:316-969(+)